MAGYKYLDTKSGYYIYENQNYIPYGFSYEYYMDRDTFESYDDVTKTKMMLKAIVLTDEQIEEYGDIMFANGYLFKGNYSKKITYNQTYTKMLLKIREALGDD
jgi:hypothetical protein